MANNKFTSNGITIGVQSCDTTEANIYIIGPDREGPGHIKTTYCKVDVPTLARQPQRWFHFDGRGGDISPAQFDDTLAEHRAEVLALLARLNERESKR